VGIGNDASFNPFGLGAFATHFPPVAPRLFTFKQRGVSAHFPQVAPIHIQTTWRVCDTFSQGCTGGYSHSNNVAR